jgi:magnesium transporter
MLYAYTEQSGRLIETHFEELKKDGYVWIDLFDPSEPEEKSVEVLFGIEIPTRDEIHDIEISSSLYQENNAAYATASLVIQTDLSDLEIHRVSFILVQNTLITLRYVEPRAFKQFISKVCGVTGEYESGSRILMELLDIIVSRCADALEKAAHTIDDTNKKIFRPTIVPIDRFAAPNVDFRSVLYELGVIGDTVSKTSEGLVSLARVTGYMEQTKFFRDHPDDKHHMDIILKDILSLRDYTTFLSEKLTFVLDATLGMISIEQNDIIKIFSVAAVLFMPPTLIASIYGMNFHHMPELQMPFGYPFAIGLMAVAAWLPYRFFKKRNWL